MAGFTDDGVIQYCYNTHLRMMEAQVFNLLAGRSTDGYARMAREDVRRDLRRFGYIDPIEPISTNVDPRLLSTTVSIRGEILNRSSKAEAEVVITLDASASAPLTIPAGTILQDLDPYGDVEGQVALDSATGALRWETLEEVEVEEGESVTVAVRATIPGAPHNLCAGSHEQATRGKMWIASPPALAADELLTAEWGSVTLAGVDHQLARLTTYAALVYAYTDLMHAKDDPMDAKRMIYEKRYKAELDRLISSGVEITQDGNSTTTDAEDRLRYGQRRLWRS